MTPINLDKLLQLAGGAKPDTAALKLMVSQVYQAQAQQLLGGQFRLQLPSAQGPLLVNLPADTTAMMQHLLQPALAQLSKTALSQQAGPNQLAALVAKIPLQVQFQPQTDGRIAINLHASGTAQSVALAPAQLRQLLLLSYSTQVGATPSHTASNATSSAFVTAELDSHKTPSSIRLPRIVTLPVSAQLQASLSQLLRGSHSNQLTVMLELSNTDKVVSADLLLPRSTEQHSSASLLNRPQQIVLLQQLVKSFNQQHLSTADSAHPAVAALKPLLNALPVSAAPFILQLQPRDGLFQLQLVPQKNQLQLTVHAEDFNRPLQFVAAPNATGSAPATAQQADLSQQAIAQAWRHLLPLLPQRPDPLSALPELPEAVQQILQLVRQSQPDSSKVLQPNQLLPQLNSMLQFQPLQTNASVQTSGGTLAVAIQLLLGHLLQKPAPAAQQVGNQKLAQLVATLEPAQASSLLRQLASHSSTLQQSQLATLDSNASTQQQLLLQLPLQQGEHSVFSQIQLEQRESDAKQDGEKQTHWQLTMKFDLEQLGPLLVVAKLQQQQLHLQFYTEQALAKRLADKFLPILKDRCAAQGLQISQADCVLGKIPDSLLPRANSLLAIKV